MRLFQALLFWSGLPLADTLRNSTRPLGCYDRVLMYLLFVLLFLTFGLGFGLGTSRRTERRLWMFSSLEFWFSSLFHCPLLLIADFHFASALSIQV
jgi:hypothetical protein